MLPQEEERLPLLVYGPHHILNERHVVWAHRLGVKLHVGFLGGSAPLAVIAAYAGAYEVLPRVAAIARLGDDMIHRERRSCFAAVDAAMVIAAQDVLPG